MKKIYTSDNHFLVHNMKNLVEAEGIELFLKNEFAQGAVGETAVFEAWPELWVINDDDYDKALEVVDFAQRSAGSPGWVCPCCGESNDGSFELCWKCQHEKSSPSS